MTMWKWMVVAMTCSCCAPQMIDTATQTSTVTEYPDSKCITPQTNRFAEHIAQNTPTAEQKGEDIAKLIVIAVTLITGIGVLI